MQNKINKTKTSESMFKIKLLVIGPCQAGKTVLSNFLADATETSNGEYYPTQGVRIIEFESGPLQVSGRNVKTEVELWDCSGNDKFEGCWPAMMRDAHGIIFAYNPDQSSHSRELDKFHSHFVQVLGLKDIQCITFAVRRPKSIQGEFSCNLSSLFSNIPNIEVNIEDDGESVRANFNVFLDKLIKAMHETRDQEELIIMNS